MRRTSEQTIPEGLAQGVDEASPNIRELAARFAEVTRRLELAERVRNQSRHDEETGAVVHETDDESKAIEYVTANGFSIVRPWEAGGAPKPTGGTFRFAVSDAEGKERQVNVQISERLIAQTAFPRAAAFNLPVRFGSVVRKDIWRSTCRSTMRSLTATACSSKL